MWSPYAQAAALIRVANETEEHAMRMQSGRRARGRNRKGPNPLTKSYESNGPDVKIRGTASHIADKYNQLARDALASGDTVTAENYLQHAEHYSRIIAAAQAQQNERQDRSDQDRADQDRADQDRSEEQADTADAQAATEDGATEGADASAAANGEGASAAATDDAGNANGNGQAPTRRRRRRAPQRETETADADAASTPVAPPAAVAAAPYPADQPQPEIDETA